MKRFKYSLENVLHYKEQILDSIKAEHGTLLAQIRKKEAEIQELENKLVSAQNKMDDLKKQDVQIKDICLYGNGRSDPEKTGTVKAFTAAGRKEKRTSDRCKDRYVPL